MKNSLYYSHRGFPPAGGRQAAHLTHIGSLIDEVCLAASLAACGENFRQRNTSVFFYVQTD